MYASKINAAAFQKLTLKFFPHNRHNISACQFFFPSHNQLKDLRNKKHETKTYFFPFYYFVTNKIKRWSFTCRGGWCHRTEREETRMRAYTWRNLNFQKNRFTQKGREFLKSCKTFKNSLITLFNNSKIIIQSASSDSKVLLFSKLSTKSYDTCSAFNLN